MSKIDLTEKEEELYLNTLSFRLDEDYKTRIFKLNCSKKLIELLLAREAIPKQRIDLFTNREFNTGRSRKSRKEVFESNGTTGSNIFSHPDFIKYLKFFIEGHNIDPRLNSKLREISTNNVYKDDTTDEIIEYLKTNSLIPNTKPERDQFAEHVFMIGADLKLDSSYCHTLRNKISG